MILSQFIIWIEYTQMRNSNGDQAYNNEYLKLIKSFDSRIQLF